MRATRPLAITTACVAAVVMIPATVDAAAPEQGTVTNHDDVIAPPGELCDFPVHVIVDETVNYQVFFDNDGSFTSFMLHVDYRVTFVANGHTIFERDKWWEGARVDEAFRQVGLTVHIDDGSSGLLQHDAGQRIFNPDGTVDIHGIHEQWDANAIPCWALQP
jgi:hypothetical protein